MKPNFFIIPIIAILTATVGSMISEEGIKRWYKNLKKPAITPPNKYFGWIWTIIFILSAVSALIIWNSNAFLN